MHSIFTIILLNTFNAWIITPDSCLGSQAMDASFAA